MENGKCSISYGQFSHGLPWPIALWHEMMLGMMRPLRALCEIEKAAVQDGK
jgi:hypothetical protein